MVEPINTNDTVALQRKVCGRKKLKFSNIWLLIHIWCRLSWGHRRQSHLLKMQETFHPEISSEELEMEVGQSMPENATSNDEQVGAHRNSKAREFSWCSTKGQCRTQ